MVDGRLEIVEERRRRAADENFSFSRSQRGLGRVNFVAQRHCLAVGRRGAVAGQRDRRVGVVHQAMMARREGTYLPVPPEWRNRGKRKSVTVAPETVRTGRRSAPVWLDFPWGSNAAPPGFRQPIFP